MLPKIKLLQDTFVQALGIPRDTDFAKLTYGNSGEWDSVAHMNLVAALERAFDIMLETEDVLGISSYPKACEILGKYGVAFDAPER